MLYEKYMHLSQYSVSVLCKYFGSWNSVTLG